MKAVLRILAIAAAFCVLPALHASDVTGQWKGAFDFNGTSVPLTFNLKADGVVVTGTIDGLPSSPVDIHDGKIDGGLVSFWANSDYEGQTYKLVYKGKIAADHIDFDFGTEDGSWGATLTAKKDVVAAASPLDVTGAWKGAFDFQGNSMPLTFNLKSAGATVTGNVEGMGATPVEIHDGKVDGDIVSFWLNADYQGQTYALNYKGKVAADHIDFDFGVADGSWGASVSVKKN